jgi:hypothetical protein
VPPTFTLQITKHSRYTFCNPEWHNPTGDNPVGSGQMLHFDNRHSFTSLSSLMAWTILITKRKPPVYVPAGIGGKINYLWHNFISVVSQPTKMFMHKWDALRTFSSLPYTTRVFWVYRPPWTNRFEVWPHNYKN